MVQCLEHAYIIVEKGKLTFPTSKPYNEKFCSNVRLLAWTGARVLVDYINEPERMCASVGWNTRAFEKKHWSSRFCCESAGEQVGESRFESLQVKNNKRKAN